MQEALRGTPFIYRFATTGTPDSVAVIGPNPSRPPTVRNIVTISTDLYQIVFVPKLCGVYTVTVKNIGGELLTTENVECVDSLVYQTAMGVQPVYHELVKLWPTFVYDESGATLDIGIDAGYSRTWFTKNRQFVPVSGWIYGISFFAHATITNVEINFVTLYSDGGGEYLVRGISENIVPHTPDEGAWGDGWRTVHFDKPVWAEAGDCFGFQATNGSGSYQNFMTVCQPNTASQAGMELFASNNNSSQLNLVGTNYAAQWGSYTHMLQCKLLISPPDVVVAGHSIIAGHCYGTNDQSGTFFEDVATPYSAENDPASMIAAMTGQVRVINCAHGSMSLYGWGRLNPSPVQGFYVADVAPLHSSMLIYESAINDTGTSDPSLSFYATLLSILSRHCAAQGTRLVLVEAPPSKFAITAEGGEKINWVNTLRIACERWCQLHCIEYVRTLFRLGMNSGDPREHDSERWQQSTGLMAANGIADFSLESDSWVHLTLAGRQMMCVAIVDQIFRGHGFRNHPITPAATDASITPPDSTLETLSQNVRTIKAKTNPPAVTMQAAEIARGIE